MYSTFHFSHRSLVVRKDTISSTDLTTLGLVIFPLKDIKQVLKVPSAEAHVISIIHSHLTRCSLLYSDQSQLKCKQQTRPKKEAPQNNCHSENPFNCLLKTLFQTESNMKHQLYNSLTCWHKFSMKFVCVSDNGLQPLKFDLFFYYFGRFCAQPHPHKITYQTFMGVFVWFGLGFLSSILIVSW